MIHVLLIKNWNFSVQINPYDRLDIILIEEYKIGLILFQYKIVII